eukprot:jgi/Psemu1/35993/gm1.35993_g
MNPLMMVPHKYKIKKVHSLRQNNDEEHAAVARPGDPQQQHQQQQQQLFCHSPSVPSSSWTRTLRAFVASGHAEDYDGLGCESSLNQRESNNENRARYDAH